ICEQEEPQKSGQVGHGGSCDGFRNPEPLSLDCGHSFCKACITANNKRSKISQEGKRYCPVCQIGYQPDNLRPNRHVANIVERLRDQKLSSEKQKRDLCVRHDKKLLLFCREDGKVICLLCERAQEHRGDYTFLIEEVAQEYQVRDQEGGKTEQNVVPNGKTPLCLYHTPEDMNGIMERATKAEVWQSIFVIPRSETLTLKKPKTFPVEQRKVSRASDLIGKLADRGPMLLGVLLISDPSTRVPLCQLPIFLLTMSQDTPILYPSSDPVIFPTVDVMLNPVYTISNIVVSVDQRQVRIVHPFTFRNIYPCDFSAFDILGHQCFSSDVSGKIAWILGIYSNKSKFNRKQRSECDFEPNLNHPNICSKYRPRYGYWVIGLQNESKYNAFEDSPTSDPPVLTLSMVVPPSHVGAILDYEAGTVSFFNVTNYGSLIYKFSKCCFSQTVYPCFNPWNCPGPITLCPPSS
ncbi:hypothetical protein HPG69_005754, partial [Diceros bicornis minor]